MLSLTEGSHSKDMCVVSSNVSLKELVFLRLAKNVFEDTSVLLRCYYAFVLQILEYCLLLDVIFSFSSARCIRWPGFALSRLYGRCVIDVMLLHRACCTKLIRTRIIFCSVSFRLLLSEFDISSCGCSSSIGVRSIKV